MSVYSRDYMRDGGSSGSPGMNPSTWNVLVWLLVINVAVFVIDLVAQGAIAGVFGLSIEALFSWRIWTPITYQFVHGGFLHLFGNMLGLFFLGRLLQQMLGGRILLRLYLLGGLAGGFTQLLFNFLTSADAPVIGASASVLAIIIAIATLVPHQSFTLLLFFVLPVRMTMRQLALFLIAIDAITLVMVLTGAAAGIAVMAHFGGMFFGWFFIRQIYPRGESRAARAERPATRKRRGLAERFGIRIIRDDETGDKEDEKTGKSAKPFVTEDVDSILDKINEHGFQSLTEKEKKILDRSSKKLSKRLDKDS